MPKPVVKKEYPIKPPIPHLETPWRIESSGVVFRLNNECTGLPDFEFTDDNGRHTKRVNGVWWTEARPGEYWRAGGVDMTAFYDVKAAVLMGDPIPAVVYEHRTIVHFDKYWGECRKHWPGRLLCSTNFYLTREDGEYVKSGSEYVFKPHTQRKLTIGGKLRSPVDSYERNTDGVLTGKGRLQRQLEIFSPEPSAMSDDEILDNIREQVNKSRFGPGHDRPLTRSLAEEAHKRGLLSRQPRMRGDEDDSPKTPRLRE